jgi:biotin carboxyl carrier protein
MNEFIVTLFEKKKKVNIISENKALIDGSQVNYELININNLTKLLRIENVFYEISSNKIDDGKYSLFINGDSITSVVQTELQERAAQLIDKAQSSLNRKINVKAPMPGMILKLKKNPGDSVFAGDSVLILEAMKMENDVKAPTDGKITEVNVKEGIAVDKGDLLFAIE